MQTRISRRVSLTAMFLVIMFFLPYFPGTPYRLDNVIGVIYILILAVIFIMKGRVIFHDSHEKILTIVSFLIIIYVVMTLLPYFSFPLQQINYQLYLAVGMSIWYVHRKTLTTNRNTVILTLLALSIPISVFAVIQFYFGDSPLVHLGLSLYSGVSSDDYQLEKYGIHDYEYNNMASIQVLTGNAMTSIFSGKHSLAQFCLVIIAIGLGAYKDQHIKKVGKKVVFLSIILAITAGIISTSKVFFFSLPIFIVIYILMFTGLNKSVRSLLQSAFIIVAAITLITLLSPQIRVLDNLVDVTLSGNLLNIFDSRYGQEGYLTQYNQIFKEPLVWLFGVGPEAGEWKISDSQYRSSILVGGLPYLVLFHSFILYLLFLNWRFRGSSPYAIPFFALGICLLLAGIGIPVYWQARIVPIWVLANMLLIISYPKK